jgi:hypothetical protein
MPRPPLGLEKMRYEDGHHCRVCGLRLDDPPWGLDGKTPLFAYCPCCGVEFGYQDSTAEGARRFRQQWIAKGAPWDTSAQRPPDWSLEAQLDGVPAAFR